MILEKLNIIIIEFIDDNLKIIEKNIESFIKSRYIHTISVYIIETEIYLVMRQVKIQPASKSTYRYIF